MQSLQRLSTCRNVLEEAPLMLSSQKQRCLDDLAADLKQKQRYMDRSLEFVDAMPFGIKRLEESISRSLKAIEDPDTGIRSSIVTLLKKHIDLRTSLQQRESKRELIALIRDARFHSKQVVAALSVDDWSAACEQCCAAVRALRALLSIVDEANRQSPVIVKILADTQQLLDRLKVAVKLAFSSCFDLQVNASADRTCLDIGVMNSAESRSAPSLQSVIVAAHSVSSQLLEMPLTFDWQADCAAALSELHAQLFWPVLLGSPMIQCRNSSAISDAEQTDQQVPLHSLLSSVETSSIAELLPPVLAVSVSPAVSGITVSVVADRHQHTADGHFDTIERVKLLGNALFDLSALFRDVFESVDCLNILTECWNSSVAILWNTIQIQCRTHWLPHRLDQVDQFRSFPSVLSALQTSLSEIGLFPVDLPPLHVSTSDFRQAHLIGVRQSLLNSVRNACVGNSFEPLSASAMADLNAQKSQKVSAQSVHFVSSPLVALMNKVNANFFGTAPADALTDAAGARVSGGIPQVVWLLYAAVGHCVDAANALDQSSLEHHLTTLQDVVCLFEAVCPSYHARALAHSLDVPLLFRSDCELLAAHVLQLQDMLAVHIQSEFMRSNLTPPRVLLIGCALSLRRLGAHYLRLQLQQLVKAAADIVGDISELALPPATMLAPIRLMKSAAPVDSPTLQRFRRLADQLSKIARRWRSASELRRSSDVRALLGRVLDVACVGPWVAFVLRLRDITESEAARMYAQAALLLQCSELRALFASDDAENVVDSRMNEFVPNWRRLCTVHAILAPTQTLNGLTVMLESKQLIGPSLFSADEIQTLVCSLYEDSDVRNQFLTRIR